MKLVLEHTETCVHYMPEAEQRHAHVPLMSWLVVMMMMSLKINDQRSVKAQVFTLLLFHLQAILTSERETFGQNKLRRIKND